MNRINESRVAVYTHTHTYSLVKKRGEDNV